MDYKHKYLKYKKKYLQEKLKGGSGKPESASTTNFTPTPSTNLLKFTNFISNFN